MGCAASQKVETVSSIEQLEKVFKKSSRYRISVYVHHGDIIGYVFSDNPDLKWYLDFPNEPFIAYFASQDYISNKLQKCGSKKFQIEARFVRAEEILAVRDLYSMVCETN